MLAVDPEYTQMVHDTSKCSTIYYLHVHAQNHITQAHTNIYIYIYIYIYSKQLFKKYLNINHYFILGGVVQSDTYKTSNRPVALKELGI